MNLDIVRNLFIDLEKYLKQHGDDSIIQSYRIVRYTVNILKSEKSDQIKEQIVIQSYKSLYSGKGGLSEFFIWDNDFTKRKELNEPLDEIHNKLWEIVKENI